MQQSPIQQRVVIGATVVTLALGAALNYFQAAKKTSLWPVAVLLGLMWGSIGLWILWRARRRADSRGKE